MALNTSNRAYIDRRRRLVARLRLRGMTQREIVEALPKSGVLNPETKEPYSLGTICYDLKAVRKAWQEDAKADIAEHKGRQLAELQEARRKVWVDGDMAEVRRSLDTEMNLLGTKAPAKIAPTDPTGEREYGDLTNDERALRMMALLQLAQQRALEEQASE